VDFYIINAFSVGECEKFSDVLGASVTESKRARIIGLIELNLELAEIPSCLRRIVVGMNHKVNVFLDE